MSDIIFDNIQIGLSNIQREDNKQLSLFDYEYQTDLPSVPTTLIKSKKHKKKPTNLEIGKIKTLKEKDEFKSKGKGTISITGATSGNNVVTTVSEKTKKELEERNKELLRVREHPYIKKNNLLTIAEKKLYKFLRSRLSQDIVIFSKIRLADIVELNEAVTRDSKAFMKIAYKHVDFALMSPDLDLICIVELDDFTHNTPKAQERDKFVEQVLRECGIALYRIGVKIDLITKEDTKAIEFCVLEYMAPTCPECGRPMEPKKSKNRYNYGHRFYGCMGFYELGDKKCRYTIDID